MALSHIQMEGVKKHIPSHSQGARRECSSILISGESAQSSPPSKHVDIMCSSVYHYTEEITRCRLGKLCSLLIRSRLPPLIIAPALAPRSQPGPSSAATAGSQVHFACHRAGELSFADGLRERGRVSESSLGGAT